MLSKLWKKMRFKHSSHYWEKRYAKGRTSGTGSYGKFAEFKAEVINGFIDKHNIETVIEYGCGDGNQLKIATYKSFVGFDVSPTAINTCKEVYGDDATKTFKLMDEYAGERAELTLSLDVIYHLVEDDVFESYMRRLFDSADRYVIIYSLNSEDVGVEPRPHVRCRKFTDWIEANVTGWKLLEMIKNKYADETHVDFYIYAKADNAGNVSGGE